MISGDAYIQIVTGDGVDELAVDEELGELDLRHHHARRRCGSVAVAAVARH